MKRSVFSTLAGRNQGKRESMNDFASSIQRLVFGVSHMMLSTILGRIFVDDAKWHYCQKLVIRISIM